MNAMLALLKFLVLLALFLSTSHANALSLVAENQVWVIHLIGLRQPMSNPKNEPSREPSFEPTNEWIWMQSFQTTFHQRKLK
jgi:hypothetical protein